MERIELGGAKVVAICSDNAPAYVNAIRAVAEGYAGMVQARCALPSIQLLLKACYSPNVFLLIFKVE